MKIFIQSFEKGMNRDLNSESVQGTYFDCENFRIFTNFENTFGGLTTVKGTELLLSLPENHIIIGACNVRDTIVLLTTNDNSDEGGQGWIYTFSINKDTRTLKTPLTLKYTNPNLKFTTKRPIEAHGYYENDNMQFIYFSDYEEETRVINLATITLGTPIEALGMFINISLPQPEVTDILPGGNLKVGVYEFLVFLTTLDGKNTLYSPNSFQIHITKSLESEPNSYDYQGENSIDLTNGDSITVSKSVKIKVDLSTLPVDIFESITFVSVFNNSLSNTPEIKSIESVNIGLQPTIEIIYTGTENSIVDIPYEEYLINTHPFYTNKTFSIIKNQLTVSNVKTQTYDIDWNPLCVRYKLGSPLMHNGMLTNDNFNNPYNDESGTAYGTIPTGNYTLWGSDHQFIYQSDQTTIGGESLDQSVKYRFITQDIDGDVSNSYKKQFTLNPNTENSISANGTTVVNKFFNDYNSPLLRSLRGYKREEIYRFGIVGIKKGRVSFVKPIGDIKFPSITEGFTTATYSAGKTTLKVLGIEFTINIPDSVDVDYIQIVRMPRTEENKTRLCQGVINKWFEMNSGSDGSNEYYPLSDIMDIEQYYATGAQLPQTIGFLSYVWENKQTEFSRLDLLSLFSPELSYETFIPDKRDTDYLKVVGLVTDTVKNNRGDTQAPVSAHFEPEGWGGKITHLSGLNYVPWNGTSGERRILFTKARSIRGINQHTNDLHREKLKATKFYNGFYGNDNQPNLFEGIQIRNYSFQIDNQNGFSHSTPIGAYNGSGLLCLIDYTGSGLKLFDEPVGTSLYNTSAAPTPTIDFRYKAFLIDYVRYLPEQYGGISRNSFEFNDYIVVSAPIYNSGTYKIFNGDTYITMFNFMKSYWDNGRDEESYLESVCFPVETCINTELNRGRTFLSGTGGFDHNDDRVYETFRAQEKGNKEGDMFDYNSVFSSELLGRPYFPKPINYKENNLFDVRTYLSLNKIIGEKINSWCKFPINSFIDVNSQYGPINRTHYYLNQLFFLQDNATGYISVNPRAVVGTSDGIPTELGTSEGLQDYNYVSTLFGCIHQRASIVVDRVLYYYDGIQRKFIMLTGTEPNSISENLGMDSFFKSLEGVLLLTKKEGGDNPLLQKGIHVAYDDEHKEIYITISGNFVIANKTNLKDSNEKFDPGQIVEYNNEFYLLIDEFKPSLYPNLQDFLQALDTASIPFDTSTKSFTLAYSTILQKFTGFYSFKPYTYFKDLNFILSPDSNKVYIHNYGEPCNFYSTVYPSYFEFIFNQEPILNKVIAYLEYSCTVKDENGDYIQNEGLDRIHIYNDYQNSTNTTLAGRQKQRFRKWRINIPRDATSTNGLARMRGDWQKIKLIYNNNNKRMLNLERVGVVYSPQSF